jgi:hypothetical protein
MTLSLSDFNKQLKAVIGNIAELTVDGEAIVEQIPESARGTKVDRIPDVRLILKTADLRTPSDDKALFSFRNPAYEENKTSDVSFDGQNAVMVMLKGDTLQDQVNAAQMITQALENDPRFENGLTPDLINEILLDGFVGKRFVAQAYGPAPFEKEKGRLETIQAPMKDGSFAEIVPSHHAFASFGMRLASKVEAYRVEFPIELDKINLVGTEYVEQFLRTMSGAVPSFIKGTDTAAERADSIVEGWMVIEVSNNWETGALEVKPIKPDAAKSFYTAAALDQMPIINVDREGHARSLHVPVALNAPKPNDPAAV